MIGPKRSYHRSISIVTAKRKGYRRIIYTFEYLKKKTIETIPIATPIYHQ